MATRKPDRSAKPRPAAAKTTEDAVSPRAKVPAKKPASKAAAKRAPTSKAKAKPRPAKQPDRARKSAAPTPDIDSAAAEEAVRRPRPLSAADRERRFNLIVQTACLKAGTAAAITAITSKAPLLGRLAPVLLGPLAETVALARIQRQLVQDILILYELDLTDTEEQGVTLLATAANIGAQQLSKRTVDHLVKQLGGRIYQPLLARMLPLASVMAEIAASVASTYAVGKRAQALCLLPGTGVRNLGELLRGLSGIDQSRLFTWSAEAFALAIRPFRGALSVLMPTGKAEPDADPATSGAAKVKRQRG
ncbi:MAG: hypothetical protein WCZ65_04620 [Lysobacteraceae bacterium]